MPSLRIVALLLIAGTIPAGCSDPTPTAAELAGEAEVVLPITVELLTGRHEFTDEIAAQFRLTPEGRPTKVVNIEDPSRMAVARITVQPGARFPWP